MATILEEFEALKKRIAKGEGSKSIHIVDHEAERVRRRQNPDRSRKIVMQCRTPEAWREFQLEKERYLNIALDGYIAVDLIIRALRQVPDAELKQWVEEGHQQLPDYLK